AEVPGGSRRVMRYRLVHKGGKRCEVEPRLAGLVAQEFTLPGFGQRETQLVAANTLRFYLEARGAGEIGRGDPELAEIFLAVDLGGDVIVDHGDGDFFGGSRQNERQQKDAR